MHHADSIEARLGFTRGKKEKCTVILYNVGHKGVFLNIIVSFATKEMGVRKKMMTGFAILVGFIYELPTVYTQCFYKLSLCSCFPLLLVQMTLQCPDEACDVGVCVWRSVINKAEIMHC